MPLLALLCGLLLAGRPDADRITCADAVTLRDGQVVLGQVVEPAPRGKLRILVRRAWAAEHVPELAKEWEAEAARQADKARAERLTRLKQWRRERQADPDDPLVAWLDARIKQLEAGEPEPTPLLAATIDRGEIKEVDRCPKESGRMLRQGWIGRLDNVESMAPDDLKSALKGRGFAQSGADEAPVDKLLPTPEESERRWLLRRAATEVSHEPGLRLIRYQNLVLPEGESAGPDDLKQALAGVTAQLADQRPADPLLARARDEARRGRVGLVVTRMDRAGDLSVVRVESTLWVRTGPDHWEPAIRRSSTVKTAEVKADDVAPLAGNEEVQSIFRTLDGLGLGEIPDEVKKRSLMIGAATRLALGTAKAALQKDLESLELDVRAPGRPNDEH